MKQKIPKITLSAMTISGAIFGPTLSSSKYLTKPAPADFIIFLCHKYHVKIIE